MTEPTTWLGLVYWILTQEYWQALFTVFALIVIIRIEDR